MDVRGKISIAHPRANRTTVRRSGVHSYSAFVTPKFTLRAHNHLSQQPYVAGVKVK